MLKRRLAKLEQTLSQNGEQKLYVVRQDAGENRMMISDLNFYGTIADGYARMEQHPNNLFVIMNIPDAEFAYEIRNEKIAAMGG